jgi:hypothetical protein
MFNDSADTETRDRSFAGEEQNFHGISVVIHYMSWTLFNGQSAASVILF